MDMYTSNNLTANQAAIAGKPAHSLIRGYLKETCQPENSGALGNMESPTWVMGWFHERVVPGKPTDKSHGHGRR